VCKNPDDGNQAGSHEADNHKTYEPVIDRVLGADSIYGIQRRSAIGFVVSREAKSHDSEYKRDDVIPAQVH
jgi:hypothetical protein